MNQLDIRVEKWPPVRGRKRIMVDGVCWGHIEMSQHGGRGNSFTFVQAGGGWRITGKTGRHAITVYGDKLAQRHQPGFDPVKPVDERIMDKIAELIAAGELRDPDVVKRELDERAAQVAAMENARAHQQRTTDVVTALALIQTHAPGLNDRDALANAMADQFARERARP